MADKGEFEAYVLAWSGRADPDGNLYSFDACKQPLNYAGYCVSEVDALLDKSRALLDTAERKKVYEQIAARVLKDRPIVYLYHRNWLWVHNAKLDGVRSVPDGLDARDRPEDERELTQTPTAADRADGTAIRCSSFCSSGSPPSCRRWCSCRCSSSGCSSCCPATPR